MILGIRAFMATNSLLISDVKKGYYLKIIPSLHGLKENKYANFKNNSTKFAYCALRCYLCTAFKEESFFLLTYDILRGGAVGSSLGSYQATA